MKLRQKSKRDQALDAVASIAKTWSEWRLGEKVTKTAAKGAKKATKAAKKKGTAKRKTLKVAGVIAFLGGIGAAIAKKVTGGKAEPLYTPPDMAEPPPSPVVVEDLAGGASSEAPADTGAGTGSGDAPATPPQGDSSADVAPEPEDLVSDAASEQQAVQDAGETTVDAGGASDDAPADRPL